MVIIRSFRGEEEDVGFLVKEQRRKKLRRSAAWFVAVNCIAAVVVALMFYFFAPKEEILIYTFTIAFAYLGVTVFVEWVATKQIKMMITKNVWVALVIIPLIFLIDFGIGAQEAHWGIQEFRDVYLLTLKDEHSADVTSRDIPVQVLRSFDKGLLMRNPKTEKILFTRWEQIKSLSHFSFADTKGSRGCARFPRICGTMPLEP
jgi:hypothetical protein